jgi:hypothetical protein
MAAVHPGALATGALQKEERRRTIASDKNKTVYTYYAMNENHKQCSRSNISMMGKM